MITYFNNNIDDIEESVQCSIEIFKPDANDLLRYHNKNNWISKIQEGGLLIVAKDSSSVVGFSLSYKKSDTHFHIWLVGVQDAYRKQGIWSTMYEMICIFAQEHQYKKLTINTFEKKYSSMYTFLVDKKLAVAQVSKIEGQGIRTTFQNDLL